MVIVLPSIIILLQAELDTLLIEAAGNLIGPLIIAAGSAITMEEINLFVKNLSGKLVGTNKKYDKCFMSVSVTEVKFTSC